MKIIKQIPEETINRKYYNYDSAGKIKDDEVVDEKMVSNHLNDRNQSQFLLTIIRINKICFDVKIYSV